MTLLNVNTSATTANAMLAISSASFDKKTKETENIISYTVVPKITSHKSSSLLSSIDWDLNMNELEFE